MSIGKRILDLRKNILNLNQEEFGMPLGITKSSVSKIEAGLNNPSSAIVISICREYHVNEEWLRHGTGDMFQPESNDLDFLVAKYGPDLTKNQREIVKGMLKMNKEQRAALDKFIEQLMSSDD